jgi:hypothetical protein
MKTLENLWQLPPSSAQPRNSPHCKSFHGVYVVALETAKLGSACAIRHRHQEFIAPRAAVVVHGYLPAWRRLGRKNITDDQKFNRKPLLIEAPPVWIEGLSRDKASSPPSAHHPRQRRRAGEGSRSGTRFDDQVLLPVLRPGDIVVLDNLGSHKSKAVRQLIRSVGAKLFFLPKYSPDLNPIE